LFKVSAVDLHTLISGLVPADQSLVQRALDWVTPKFSEQLTGGGETFLAHAFGSAKILAAMQADAATRAAALLMFSAESAEAPGAKAHVSDPVAKQFGSEVAQLVQGTLALSRLGALASGATSGALDSIEQKEMLRKMLLAMAADLRIVLIRLASRLQTLRWLAAEKRPCDPMLARETLDLYTPLANRLGIWQVKWEMEDLAFRFIDPQRYKDIAKLLEEKRVEREEFIAQTIEQLAQGLAARGIASEVSGRPKHIYSIHNKMRTKQLAFSELYDVRALRIIVHDERECYAALGLVHELWVPVSDEFDDYISRPKPNGYKSLHTVVADAAGRPFEVQIRTRAMHEFAEFGMAAHWRYKEVGTRAGQATTGQAPAVAEYDRQLAWMRQLLAWNTEAGAQSDEPQPSKPRRVTQDRIYVLSPQARVIELPIGATAVDFAYHLHSDLGHRCRGARVDGQMVTLSTQLQTGQTVEIVTTKSGGPSRDWLNPQLGFLASPRARAKVRAWFNAIELAQRTTQGQALVEKELQRLGKTAINLEQLAQQLGFARADDLYVAAAKEEFSLRQIDAVLQPAAPEPELRVEDLMAQVMRAEGNTTSGKGSVLVVGVGSLLTQLARCCRPAPPDAIQGFVTRGRGVSIHRSACSTFADLSKHQPERVIEVAWSTGTPGSVYPVEVIIQAQDRPGLLRDLSEVFARLRLNVIAVNTQSKASIAYMAFTAEIRDGNDLQYALSALGEVSGVFLARRR
jgi:GTP pyrophosphokinase